MSDPIRAPVSSRLDAAAWALRAVLVLSVIGGAMLGLERLVLSYPGRLGPAIEGFPTDALESLQRVRSEIAFFGDSIVQTVALHDGDSRFLPDMVADELDRRVVRVSQAATGAELHAAWLGYLSTRAVRPRAVVVPVNPRSFSPHWERNPPWVFRDVAAGVRHPLFARLASVLEWDWGRPTDAEFAATPIVVSGAVVGTIAELDQGGLGDASRVAHDRYLVRYASDYARSARLSALRQLVDEASRQPFPVILYLTPIDREAAAELLTPDELAAVDRNLDLLRAELARSVWPTVDVSTAVPHADFDHPPDDPHEHLRGAGRIVVATAVASALREALGLPAPAERALAGEPSP